MLNHPAKLLFVLISSLLVTACHKAPTLDNALALKLLSTSGVLSGYCVNMVTNNPNARGKNSKGWTCDDKKLLVDSGVVMCKESGRSGVYLKFTDKGKKLLVGEPWGNSVLRNAKVIAVTRRIDQILSIEMIDKTHAIINFAWAYDQHTPFSNDQLKKTIALNVPQIKQVSAILNDKTWTIEK